VYNPSYLGCGDWKDGGWRSAWEKSLQDPILINGWEQWYACHLQLQKAGPGIKQDPVSKITSVKGAGGIAQVVDHLPSKHRL
jgi:hypothetical protein